jgi:hypothetical protein
MLASPPHASVIDSGSTNRPGVTVTLDEIGNATVSPQDAQPQTIKLDAQLGQQLMRDIKAAGTLSAIPRKHCVKSISFGSSLYVEFNGDRSPDLNCGVPEDSRAAALQKDAKDVLAAVQKQIDIMRVRPRRPVRPINQ